MRKFKLFFACLLMAVLSIGQVWGATETLTLSENGWSNESVQSSVPATSATIALAKNSAGTSPTYYTADGLRLYGVKNTTTGCSIAFTAVDAITGISFTHGAKNSGVLSASTGTYSNKVWSGNLSVGSTVTFATTNTGTQTSNPQVKITVITITYKAKVTFNANGGSCTPSSSTQASPTASVELPTPTRDGYNCTGWYTSNDTKRGDPGDSYVPSASETLYAHWESASCANKVTITKGTPVGGSFNLNITGEQNCCSELVVNVTDITAATGKRFKQITQSGLESGVTIDQTNKTVTYAANSNGASTINVEFENIPTHNIIFNNGGVKSIANAVVAEGESYDITETIENSLIASCTYKKFEGWTRSSSINANVKPTLVTSVEMEDEDVDLYAVYSITTGGGGSTPASITILPSDFGTSYPSGTDGSGTISKGDYSFTYGQFTQNQNGTPNSWCKQQLIQARCTLKIGLWNTTEMDITSVVVYKASPTGNSSTWAVYESSSSEKPTTGAITPSVGSASEFTADKYYSSSCHSGELTDVSETPHTYTASSGCKYIYFAPTNGASYFTKIIINHNISGGGTTTYSLDAGCAAPGQCVAPTFDPGQGTYDAAQSVELATTTDGADIYYTTDNSTPSSTNGTKYTSAISVTQNTTIKAIAIKDGMDPSEVSTGEFKIRFATAPTFGPTEGDYTSAQSVTMAATGAEHIYYTMTSDGSTPADPTIESLEYTDAIPLSANGTYKFKAIAVKAGFAPSNVTSATYTLDLPYGSIAEFIAGAPTTAKSLTLNNAIITGVSGTTIYIQDETAGIIIYGLSSLPENAAPNHSISGTIKGTYTLFKNQHELENGDLSDVTISASTVARPTISEFSSLSDAYAEKPMMLVTLTEKNYSSYTPNNTLKNSYAMFGGEKIYNTFLVFSDATVWPESSVSCDITGIVLDYNGTMELLPVFVSDIVADDAAAAPVFTPAGGADAENAVQVDLNSYVAITAADAKHSVNVNQVQITSTDPVSVTAISSRDFYRSTSVTKWYYGNSASASYDINGQGSTTEGTIVAQVGGVNASSAAEGDEVHILITPNTHFELATITVNGNDPDVVSAGTEYSFEMPAAAVTIAVTWNEDAKVNVQFAKGKEAAEGTVPSTMSGKYENDVITLPANPFTLASWKFKGWKHSLTDAIHQPGSYTITAADVAEDAITFAAEWEAMPNFAGGDWILVTDVAELTEGSYVMIAAADYNYAMKPWVSNANHCVRKAATKDGEFLTYDSEFAIFEVKNYVVAEEVVGKSFLNVNSAKYLCYSSGLKEQTAQADASAWTLSFDGGNVFHAYNKNATTYEIRYNNNSGSERFACYAGTQNAIALYKYHTPSLKLTYDKNAGDDVVTGMPSMGIADGDNKVTISDATPHREGYLFDGWNSNPLGGGTVYEANQEYTLTANLTIYAQWQTATAHPLSYDKDGGEGDVPAAADYYPNVNVTLANAVTKEGYIFAGWEYDGNIYAAGTSFTMPNEEVVMKAKYAIGAVYTITSRTEVTAQGAPAESTATFVNTYENDKSQMTSGHSMTLTLTGYDLYTIKAITLRMKSNASKGYGTLSVTIGGNPVSFTTNKWYDEEHYSSSYEDIKVTLTPTRVQTDENIVIEIAASQNSLYCQSFAIEYERVLDDIRTAGISSGVWGTICPKKEVKYPAGASFFEISYVEYHSGVPYKVFYDEIAEGASLEAGHPYLFQAAEESTAIKGIAVGDDATIAINDHGFKGVLENETISVVTADVENYRYYIVYNNEIRLCGEGQFLIRAERAYLDMSDPEVEKQYKAPINGRRRVALTNNAPQVATGMDELNASEAPVKVMIDGKFYILRGEKMYDATGKLVK